MSYYELKELQLIDENIHLASGFVITTRLFLTSMFSFFNCNSRHKQTIFEEKKSMQN